MGLRYGRIGAATAAVMLVVGLSAGSVAAAEPPPGVVMDGRVTVTWIDEVSLLPVDGATITVAALAEGESEPFQLLAATTDAAGVAVVEDVARPGPDSAPFLLYIEGQKSPAPTTDEAGCTHAESWSAAIPPTEPSAEIAVRFDLTTYSSSLSCPSSSPSGGVAALTSRPQVTPPNTATTDVGTASTPALPGLLVVLLVTTAFVGLTAPARLLPVARRRR